MKNQSYTSHTKRTARMVSIAGGVLFWIFSLAYLAVFQGNMLVLRVYDLFHLAINAWVLAFIVTAVLFLLAVLMKRLTGGNSMELAYAPSFLLLGLMTFSPEGWHLSSFIWTVLFTALAFVLLWKRTGFNAMVLRMIFLCLLTVSMGNTNEKYHNWESIEIQQVHYK